MTETIERYKYEEVDGKMVLVSKSFVEVRLPTEEEERIQKFCKDLCNPKVRDTIIHIVFNDPLLRELMFGRR